MAAGTSPRGLPVDIQPKEFTVAALAKEIAEGFGGDKNA